jgi:hypothetical protein
MNRATVLAGLVALASLGAGESFSAGLPDPMAPRVGGPRPAVSGGTRRTRVPGPQLQAVMGDRKHRVAIVDGRPVEVGQRIGRLRVLAIHAHSIETERNGRRSVLRLPKLQADTEVLP